MKFKNKRYLVTGGAGFIGSNLVKDLLKKGAKVTVIDNFDSYYSVKQKNNNLEKISKSENFKLIKGSILNQKKLSECFTDDFDAVIHLAAKAGVRNSIDHPSEYFKTNVMGTLMILEQMKKLSKPHLIFASSSSVYGDNRSVPFRENDKTDNQISPYAASKRSAELLCQTYSNLYKVNTTILRFFTVYGPHGRPDMAPYLFMKAAISKSPITKYGSGESKRDYTYIDDVVDGIVKSLEKKFDFEIFNIGNSKPITLNEFIEKVEKTSGTKIKKITKDLPAGDVSVTCACIDKAKKMIKWSPKTNLDSGLKSLYRWLIDYV